MCRYAILLAPVDRAIGVHRFIQEFSIHMFKNLNATVLGISGRQSELIELAMTLRLQGLGHRHFGLGKAYPAFIL